MRGLRDRVMVGALALSVPAAAVLTPLGGVDPAGASITGDGFGTLVVGVPGDGVGGALARITLRPDGTVVGDQLIDQDSVIDGAAVKGGNEANDDFGRTVAVGDIDGDGSDDVLVGAPLEDVNPPGPPPNEPDAGAAWVLYSDGSKLTAVDNEIIAAGLDRLDGRRPENNARLGASVISGDFDGDGRGDLITGLPGKSVNSGGQAVPGAGQIIAVSHGSSAQFGGRVTSYLASFEPDTRFGTALAAADIDGDGNDDAVVGQPGAETDFPGGQAVVYFGSGRTNAPVLSSPLSITQDGSGDEAGETGDFVGGAVAAGDFDGDGRAEVAVGAPFESFATADMAGAVTVFDAPDPAEPRTLEAVLFLHQGVDGVADEPELADQFGGSLATGDVNGDGYDDLLVGVHDEKVDGPNGEVAGAGAVHVFFGSASGLRADGGQFLHAEPDALLATAAFGKSVAVGDLTGDGIADAAIGVPFDMVDGRDGAGRVEVWVGGPGGLRRLTSISQATDGVSGEPGSFDEFGAAVAISAVPRPRTGYWMADAVGGIHPFGDAEEFDPVAPSLGSTLVDVATDRRGRALWALDSAGVVHTRGPAAHHGDADLANPLPGESASALSPTPTGDGYWIFTSAGRVIARGDAVHHGDLVDLGITLDGPVVDSVATPTGDGYFLLGSDGGIFTFGDAVFRDSVRGALGGAFPDQPAVAIVPTPGNDGYWVFAADGGVFSFDAPFLGSVPGVLPPGASLDQPVNGGIPFADGYLLVADDGGIFNFSTEAFLGSLGGGNSPAAPVIGVAGFAT